MSQETNTTATVDLCELASTQFDDSDDNNDATATPDTLESSEIPPTLIRKKQRRGPQPRAIEAWKHARLHLPHEEAYNKHRQKIFYCKYCPWTGVVQNSYRHLRAHQVFVKEPPSLCEQATANSLKASFSRQELIAQEKAEKSVRNILRNACNKTIYRDAVARLVTSNSLAHNLVESPEWKAVCISLNWMAGP